MREGHVVGAVAAVDVDEVHARRRDLDEQLAIARLRHVELDRREHLGAARPHRLHRLHPRRHEDESAPVRPRRPPDGILGGVQAEDEAERELPGVGPWPGARPDDDRYDPELLAHGDPRNVVDRYRYWRMEAIVADLDPRRHPFAVAIENWQHDLNIGSIVRTANAFAAETVHIVGRRRWNKRGAMVTDRYQHVRAPRRTSPASWRVRAERACRSSRSTTSRARCRSSRSRCPSAACCCSARRGRV